MQSTHIPEYHNDAEISININGEVILEIEKELKSTPCDVISLGFLLYDNPNTALKALTAYQQESKIYDFPLYEWCQHIKAKPTWKHEFLEALLICQLYGIVRKLGFNVSSMKRYYNPCSLQYSVHINLFKKVLYKLCEDIDSENRTRLKRALRTYGVDVTDHEATELTFLKLMCMDFITVNNYEQVGKRCEYNIEKLAKIIENLPYVRKYATELRKIESKLSGEQCLRYPVTSSTPIAVTTKVDVHTQVQSREETQEDVLNEVFHMINQLSIEDINKLNIRRDAIS